MLKTNSKENTQFLANSCDNSLLHELNFHEASIITGGFRLANNTDRTQVFFPFSATLTPNKKVLQPGKQGKYGGGYVLFNSSRSGYTPVIGTVEDSNGDYQFSTQGDETLFQGGLAL